MKIIITEDQFNRVILKEQSEEEIDTTDGILVFGGTLTKRIPIKNAKYRVEKAVELYNKFEESDPGSITFPEATINFMGYQAMQQGQNDDAIALFKLNADTYPNSANVWDSYSDGLQAIGDNAGALECYKKVLEILPIDTLIGEGLKETLRTNAEAGIERLSGDSNE